MTAESGTVRLSVPAEAPFIRVARLVGAGLANDVGLDVERLDDVRLALGEVCALGAHAGAASIELRYSVTDHRLEVAGECVLGDGDEAAFEDDQLGLVNLILDVACTEHRVDHHDDRFSFWLTFEHGS